MKKKFLMLLAPDDSANGGGGSGDPDSSRKPSTSDILNRFGNDTVRMADRVASLEGDNYRFRDKNRELKSEVEALKSKIPAEGAKVLSADEAKLWEAYQELGKPDELKTTLDTGKAAIIERDAFKKNAAIETAAKVCNFKPGVLKILGKDLNIEIKDVDVQTEDGGIEKQQRAFVKLTDSAGVESEKLLQEYFKAQGDDVISSLEANEMDGQQNNGSTSIPYPPQSAGKGAQDTGSYASLVENMYAHNKPKQEK